MLDKQILDRLSDDLRAAHMAVMEASHRMLSGRYRRDAQNAAESVLGIVPAFESAVAFADAFAALRDMRKQACVAGKLTQNGYQTCVR